MKKMKKTGAGIFNFAAGALLVLVIWYICYVVMNVNVLPNPLIVLAEVPSLFEHGILMHLARSLFRVAVALALSMAIGLAIGILASGSNVISRILTPFLYFTYPIPRVALLPAVMLIFGLTDTAKIIMIALIVVYPIIIVVRDIVKDIPKQTKNVLVCYGANRTQLFFYVTLPYALTGILSTARISLGTSMSILFFTEAYGARQGMGFFILDSWFRLNYVQMYAGIVVLSITGFMLFVIIDVIDNVALKWRKIQ
jgi:NitT/TauT family transport system permease protein